MKRSRFFVAAAALALLTHSSACVLNAEDSPPSDPLANLSPAENPPSAPSIVEPADFLADDQARSPIARGFGTITGRRPATTTVVPGVRLRAHDVRVTIRDGFARTEIEEEFANDTDVVLEGRYVFPLPPGSSLSRLGLWVENDLVLGEMVERDRAARIFQGIVDDVVRPRDPALLEWAGGSSFSLKIFPMPARKSRKVLLAYDEILPVVNGRARYTYPLFLGPDRAVQMDSFRLHVTVEDLGAHAAEAKITGQSASLRTEDGKLHADFSANQFVPEGDFVLDYPRPDSESVPVAIEGNGSSGFFSIRVPIPAPTQQSSAKIRPEKVLVLDASHGITETGFASAVRVAKEVVRRLRPDDRFAILLCDSACKAYPERGLAAKSSETLQDVYKFLRDHKIGGSSDIASALVSGLQRLNQPGQGQVIYLGDGSPSAGEMKIDTIAARARPVLAEKRAELRLIGTGPSTDEVVLLGLAENLSAAYERLTTGEAVAQRAAQIAQNLDQPLLTGAKIELPSGFVDVIPSAHTALRAGEELLLVGKLAGASGSERETIRVTGEIDGETISWSRPLVFSHAPAENRNVLSRRWATARIEQLERRKDDASTKEIVQLSIKNHVMSRHTSLIVLENERMFATFGIPRTHGNTSMSSAAEMGGGGLRQNDPIGDSFGSGGLGLSGIGTGGGGSGPGMGIGFGAGHGRLGGAHRAKTPFVRMGSTSVSGRLPPEVIQRIVRQNFGRFRLCYEQGLQRNPNLQGRVVVRFVISREGNVQSAGNGGSDLPDGAVVSCVVRAFWGFSFPQPEGGTVTVTYPIMFSNPDSASPPAPFRPWWGSPNFFAVNPADDAWRAQHAESIAKLQQTLEASKESRRAREALITGLLVRGRFDDAFREATAYVSLDPDRTMPHELLARSAAVLAKEELALVAMDTQVDLDSANIELHKRVARAFEASRDEVRACAHWRSAAELNPRDELAQAEAMRCRARLLGENDEVLAILGATKTPSQRLSKLRDAMEKSAVPMYDPGRPAGEKLSASITCPEGVEGCPRLVILDPTGRILTPIVPGSSRSGSSWVSVASPMDGTYRVLVTGGLESARGVVEVRLDNIVKKFDVRGGEGVRSAAILSVSTSGF